MINHIVGYWLNDIFVTLGYPSFCWRYRIVPVFAPLLIFLHISIWEWVGSESPWTLFFALWAWIALSVIYAPASIVLRVTGPNDPFLCDKVAILQNCTEFYLVHTFSCGQRTLFTIRGVSVLIATGNFTMCNSNNSIIGGKSCGVFLACFCIYSRRTKNSN
jgi:hypothetical protein